MAAPTTTAVITRLGAELQAKLMTGAEITITTVKSGSGSVNLTDLKDQTAVSQIKQTGTIQYEKSDVYTATISAMFTNKGLSTGYGLRQIGFYATDPDVGEILYAIAQIDQPAEVPDEATSPGFSLVWNVHFNLSNELNLTVTIDPAGLVTFGSMPLQKGPAKNTAQLPDGASEAVEEGGFAFAKGSKAKAFNTMLGKYPEEPDGCAEGGAVGDLVVIGNGTPGAPSNSHRFTADGQTYAKGAYNSTGADYSEYFEWMDGNSQKEDRRGYFVTLDGEKIRIAEPGEYILGVISASPSIIGNSDEYYNGKWQRDEFGAFLMVDGKGVLSPAYDPEQRYIPRCLRPEWATVGLLGQLIVRQDGTCDANDFCTVGTGGVATFHDGESRHSYRVLKRISDKLVKILLK